MVGFNSAMNHIGNGELSGTFKLKMRDISLAQPLELNHESSSGNHHKP